MRSVKVMDSAENKTVVETIDTRLGPTLLRALRDCGAKEIFGIPGDFALPFFDAIEESALLPLYTLSHEPSLGFAADAAARICARPSVAAVTYGAGALNLVNSIAVAYAEKSPVVVVSGAPGAHERRAGLLLHHQAKTLDSQMRIYREITCDQVTLDDVATAPARIAQVLQSCTSHSQPVYIELPRDMVGQRCGPVPARVAPGCDPDALDACAREILDRLNSAERPVLMVGVEVRRFGLEVKVAELARRLQIPVVTSFLGRGVLESTDAPVIGTYLGVAGRPEVSAMVEESDRLLLLGVIISDTNFATAVHTINLGRTIQAVDGQVTLEHHTYPCIPLAALIGALLRYAPQSAPGRFPALTIHPCGMVADDAPIAPIDVATAINDTIAKQGLFPVASDVGDCLFTSMDIEHTALVATGYYASMGFGVPAGLGIQAATGKRPLILVGDGAFQMTGWELGNCRRYGWDPIVVVLNNRGWGMLRAFRPQAKFNDLGDWHIADLAVALGGNGVRVHTRRELRDALAGAFARRGSFQLIEVMLPLEALSPTLKRFVSGVKRLHGPQPTPSRKAKEVSQERVHP